MSWWQARELRRDGQGTGLWHYTCAEGSGGDGRVFAVGFCSENCPGHASPAEAEAHWHEFQLANSESWTNDSEQLRCEVDGCGQWTTQRMRYGPNYALPENVVLCPAHCGTEHLALVMEARRAKQKKSAGS
jgi:hypothetical protein